MIARTELPDFICEDRIAHDNLGNEYTFIARKAADDFAVDESRDHHRWKPDWEIADNTQHTFELNGFSQTGKAFRPFHAEENLISIPGNQTTSKDLLARFLTSYNIHADMLRYLSIIPTPKNMSSVVDTPLNPLTGTFSIKNDEHIYGVCRSLPVSERLGERIPYLRSAIPSSLENTTSMGYDGKYLSICKKIELPTDSLDAIRKANALNGAFEKIYKNIVEIVKDIKSSK